MSDMSGKILNSVGKRIGVLRKEKGLNQLQLVERLNKRGVSVARSSMSEIENDVTNPSLALLGEIVKELGTTSDYLLLLSDDPFPPQSTETQLVVEAKSSEERQVLEEILELINDYSLDDQRNILDVLRFIVKDKKPRIIGGE